MFYKVIMGMLENSKYFGEESVLVESWVILVMKILYVDFFCVSGFIFV